MKNKNCVFCFVIPLACTISAATFATPSYKAADLLK